MATLVEPVPPGSQLLVSPAVDLQLLRAPHSSSCRFSASAASLFFKAAAECDVIVKRIMFVCLSLPQVNNLIPVYSWGIKRSRLLSHPSPPSPLLTCEKRTSSCYFTLFLFLSLLFEILISYSLLLGRSLWIMHLLVPPLVRSLTRFPSLLAAPASEWRSDEIRTLTSLFVFSSWRMQRGILWFFMWCEQSPGWLGWCGEMADKSLCV